MYNMNELTRPYILRVTVGYGISETGRRYEICKVEQRRNPKVAKPLNTYNRSGYYHKPLRLLIQDDFDNGWDRECHLFIYNANDFEYKEGILYE